MSDRPTVLVVDDDQDVVKATSLRLRAAGYHIISAFDGGQGVLAAIDQQPDAILLDVRMPRMDGLAALEKLRQCDQTKDIPVVMLSASLVDKQAALDAGARYFLTKPYEGETLLAAVESAITEASEHWTNSRISEAKMLC